MVPALGPVVRGDKSLLDHDLTHATSGLPLYPAFDTGWTEGDVVVAPERVAVMRHSGGPNAGWSLYAEGDSRLRYFITHLRSDRAPVGAVVAKGGRLGNVGNFEGARVPHAHVGVNVELLLGAGVQLRHNTNYTHGQPTIGAQLAALLPDPPEEVDVYPWLDDWIRWNWHGRNEGAPRPSNVPDAIPADALEVGQAIDSVVRLYGPAVVYSDWRNGRLLGDPMPSGLPVPIPKRWWDAATRDHAFANRYAEKLVAAVSSEKAAVVADLQGRIAALEAELAESGASDDERDARLRALLEQALAELAG